MTTQPPRVAGVRFRNAGRIFYFDTVGLDLETGEYVVVETVRGPEVARVVIAPGQVVVNEMRQDDLKPILRLATEADIRKADALGRKATELLPEARRIAADAGFRGHIDSAEFTLDGKRLTFSFASETRLDYRDFLRQASRAFDARIDMRQIGARDRAKLAGGYGICGRELCCANWLDTFPAISIRMAKEQDLPLNPQKISGLCGRLLCCLSYEEEGYKEMRQSLPRIGQRCSTPTGEGRVIGVNVLRRQVTLVVDGQRVDVEDRDLGTVVRWDPDSKSAPPPPSLAPVAVVETSADTDAPAADSPEAPPPTRDRFSGRIRERRPPPPPRQGAPPSRQGPPPSQPGQRREPARPAPDSLSDAPSRSFRRAGPRPPSGPRPGAQDPQPPQQPRDPSRQGNRRGNRRRGPGTPPPTNPGDTP